MRSTLTHQPRLQFMASLWRILAVLALVAGAMVLLMTPRVGDSAVALEVFDSPGVFNFIVPAGVTSLTVEAWGSGGGGGGATSLLFADTTLRSFSGAGGGGGAYARSTVAVVPGQTYTVTVAAGGMGGGGGFDVDDGANGAASSFSGHGILVDAGGGAGGAGGLVGGTPPGGAGGSVFGSNGDTVRAGGDGGAGGVWPNWTGGGGGGGSAGASAGGSKGGDGNCTGVPACDSAVGGAGGTGGGAAGGAGGSYPDGGPLANAIAGSGPGGGGGGGVAYDLTGSSGANGAHGKIQVTWGSDPEPPPAGPGCAAPSTPHATFSPALAPSGIMITIWGGGSVTLFPPAISYWATHMGELVGFIPGAPAFVNSTFIGAFTENVPPCTGFIVRR